MPEMKTYAVTISKITHYLLEIEASSEPKAKAKAWEIIRTGKVYQIKKRIGGFKVRRPIRSPKGSPPPPSPPSGHVETIAAKSATTLRH
jgi:hypothetical protein